MRRRGRPSPSCPADPHHPRRRPGPWNDLAITGYPCTPLLDRGKAFGTLTLLPTGDHVFDGHTVALAEELARRAASAARNARQFTHRVTLARELQAGLLLPDLPRVPGVDLATRYHPAGEGREIGGDFYDVFPLDDGRWAFMLGDVCGRGAVAATTTALVRHTARAVARLLPGPDAVVQAVNTAPADRAEGHGTGFVNFMYGHLTATATGLDIDLVRAGHNLPLRLGNGVARFLDVPGSLIGIAPHAHLPVHRVHLDPNESLLLYTDSITEARDTSGEQFGDDRLATALTLTPSPSARRILDTLIGAVDGFTAGHTTDDDQAVLALTATGLGTRIAPAAG